MNRLSLAGRLSAVVLLVSSALSILGVFLPWMEMLHLSRSGFRGDGYLVLVGGGIGVLAALRIIVYRKTGTATGLIAVVAGIVTGGLGLFHFLQIEGRIAQAQADPGLNVLQKAALANAGPGVGLYLCMLGGLLLILTGLVVCGIRTEPGEPAETGDEGSAPV